ncbi:MAG TPA: protein-methionine-sulfoxide reductase heme-binding subunit MsrQ [Pyrinomonadaceae bacterium]|nr:protein-methionine-sulfoxide reductase heme-binding subunit MsrQ [Pyrinomonadaceae bacterium]
MFSKVLVFVNCLVPGLLLAWDWWRGSLGADPLNFITRSTGTLTLVFLVLTLAVTPARKLTGANWLIKFRRMLGLYAFFYGSLHLLTYVWFDKAFNLRAVLTDVAQRRFILVGMLAFALMIPLAVTSTNKMIKRVGGKRWARLHRLVYVSAVTGVLHFYLLVKADTTKPLLFGAAVALLLGYRLLVSYRQARPTSLGISTR